MAKRWWEQDGLDLEGGTVGSSGVGTDGGGEDTDRTEMETDKIGGRIM